MDGPGWRVGSRFGPYELRALLGKGGMGEVYEAYDTVKDRVVAVKLLPEELAKDPVYQVRFRRESQAAARLAEPHIIPIHDWGVIDGVLFIDMRLVPGTDLRSLLRAQGPMDPARAIGLVEQIAAALDAAHADGLVHRDVKPANILVTEADFAYLADFGIAHTEGDSAVTQVGMAVGSYVYMAPERFDAGQVTGRADIYSLACVLHECLTGATPFPQASMSVLVRSHLTETPPRASVARPGVPPALDDVIARAMAKDPADRYPTAAAFAQAARAIVPVPAPAPKFVVHAPDPSRFGQTEATRNVVVPPEATGEFSVIQPPAATEVSLVDFQFTALPEPEPAPSATGALPIRPFPDAHLYGADEQFPSGQFTAVPAAEAPVTEKYVAPYGSEPTPYTPPEDYASPQRYADPEPTADNYPQVRPERLPEPEFGGRPRGYEIPPSDPVNYSSPPSDPADYPRKEHQARPERLPEPEPDFGATAPRPEPRGNPESWAFQEARPETAPRGFAAAHPGQHGDGRPEPSARNYPEPQSDPDSAFHSEPHAYPEQTPRGPIPPTPVAKPDPQRWDQGGPQAYSESGYAAGPPSRLEPLPAARGYPVEPNDPETRQYSPAQAYSDAEYTDPDYDSPQPYRPAAEAYSNYQHGPDYEDDRYSSRGGGYVGSDDYGYEPDDRPAPRGSVVVPILVGLASVVLVAVAGAVGWQMFGAGSSQPSTAASSETVAATATPPAAAPGTPVPQTSSKSSTTTSGTAVKLPDGASPCSTSTASSGNYGRAATGSEVTSCQFAEAVRKAYAESASGSRAPSSVVATSPVTGRSYTMNCSAQGQVVTCSGGDNAVVYVY
ncbi:protein kinase [Nocardia sp. NPDC127579]|uniref:serine/threonine-protein kinase n=1 Tax=Nocardia sp. NPDC127579 TaxID=3345402 RepID=UPI003636E50A